MNRIVNNDAIDYVNQKLINIYNKEGNLKTVSDEFIFSFGPLMCMTKGFEKEVDEISKYSRLMKIMQFTAFLYRKITNSISYKDSKILIKDFLITVDDSFPEDATIEKTALIEYAKNYLKIIRDEQKEKNGLESFMTSASPIVPYKNTIQRADLENFNLCESICKCIDIDEINDENIIHKLWKLLLKNLAGIMCWNGLIQILQDEKNNFNLLQLDKLMYQYPEIPIEVKTYYILAAVKYYNISLDSFKKYIAFFKYFGDFSKKHDQESFNNMIKESSIDSYSNSNLAMEFLSASEYSNDNVNKIEEILKSHKFYTTLSQSKESTEGKYDLDLIKSFISINTYIKFEEFPNREFLSSVNTSKILDMIYSDGNEEYYDTTDNYLIIPFLDIRDYRAKIMALKAYDNKIQVYNNYNEIPKK